LRNDKVGNYRPEALHEHSDFKQFYPHPPLRMHRRPVEANNRRFQRNCHRRRKFIYLRIVALAASILGGGISVYDKGPITARRARHYLRKPEKRRYGAQLTFQVLDSAFLET